MKMQNIKSTSKKFISGLLVIGGMMFSMTASAQQPSVTTSVTEFVVNQSQQLVKEMAVQLKQTINEEIKNFSIADSLIWDSEESSQVANKKLTKKSNKKSAE